MKKKKGYIHRLTVYLILITFVMSECRAYPMPARDDRASATVQVMPFQSAHITGRQNIPLWQTAMMISIANLIVGMKTDDPHRSVARSEIVDTLENSRGKDAAEVNTRLWRETINMFLFPQIYPMIIGDAVIFILPFSDSRGLEGFMTVFPLKYFGLNAGGRLVARENIAHLSSGAEFDHAVFHLSPVDSGLGAQNGYQIYITSRGVRTSAEDVAPGAPAEDLSGRISTLPLVRDIDRKFEDWTDAGTWILENMRAIREGTGASEISHRIIASALYEAGKTTGDFSPQISRYDTDPINLRAREGLINSIAASGKEDEIVAFLNEIGLDPDTLQLRYDRLRRWHDDVVDNRFKSFAVFPDRHGDVVSTKALVAHLASRGVQEYRFSGDYFDRETDPNAHFELLDFFENELQEKAVYTFGNHDLFLLRLIQGGDDAELAFTLWISNGGSYVLQGAGFTDLEPLSDFYAQHKEDAQRIAKIQQFLQANPPFAEYLKSIFHHIADSNQHSPAKDRMFRLIDWLRKNTGIYHVDQYGIGTVHAGLPLDQNANVLLAYDGREGMEALAELDADFRIVMQSEATQSGPAKAVIAALDDFKSVIMIRRSDEYGDEGWTDYIRYEDAADYILDQTGLTTINFAHTTHNKISSRTGYQIFGIALERDGVIEYSARRGIVYISDDGSGGYEEQVIFDRDNLIKDLKRRMRRVGNLLAGNLTEVDKVRLRWARKNRLNIGTLWDEAQELIQQAHIESAEDLQKEKADKAPKPYEPADESDLELADDVNLESLKYDLAVDIWHAAEIDAANQDDEVSSGVEADKKLAEYAEKLKSGDVNARREAADGFWRYVNKHQIPDAAGQKQALEIAAHFIDPENETDATVRGLVATAFWQIFDKNYVPDSANQKTALELIKHYIDKKSESDPGVRRTMVEALHELLYKNHINQTKDQNTAIDVVKLTLNRENENDSGARRRIAGGFQKFIGRLTVDEQAGNTYIHEGVNEIFETLMRQGEKDSDILKDVYESIELLSGAIILNRQAARTDMELNLVRISMVVETIGTTNLSEPYFHGETLLNIAAILELFEHEQGYDTWERIVEYVNLHPKYDEAYEHALRAVEELLLDLKFMHAVGTPLRLDADFAGQIASSELMQFIDAEGAALFPDSPLYGLAGQVDVIIPANSGKNTLLFDAIKGMVVDGSYPAGEEDAAELNKLAVRARKAGNDSVVELAEHYRDFISSGTEISKKLAELEAGLKSSHVNTRQEAAENLWNFLQVSSITEPDDLATVLGIVQHYLSAENEEDNNVRLKISAAFWSFLGQSFIAEYADQTTALDIIRHYLDPGNERDAIIRRNMSGALWSFLKKTAIVEPAGQTAVLGIIRFYIDKENESDEGIHNFMSMAIQEFLAVTPIASSADQTIALDIIERYLSTENEKNETMRRNISTAFMNFVALTPVAEPANQETVLRIIEYYLRTGNEKDMFIVKNMSTAFLNFLTATPVTEPANQSKALDIVKYHLNAENEKDENIRRYVSIALWDFFRTSYHKAGIRRVRKSVYADIYRIFENLMRANESDVTILEHIYNSVNFLASAIRDLREIDEKTELTDEQAYIEAISQIQDYVTEYPQKPYLHGENLINVAGIISLFPRKQGPQAWHAASAYIEQHPEAGDDFEGVLRTAEELSINLRFMADAGTPAVPNQSFADQIDANIHLQAFEKNNIILYGDQVLFGLTLQFEIDKPDSVGKNAAILDAIEAIARTREKQGRELTQTEQNLIEAMLQFERPAVLGIDPLNARTRKRFNQYLNRIVASGTEAGERLQQYKSVLLLSGASDRRKTSLHFSQFIADNVMDLDDEKEALNIIQYFLNTESEKDQRIRRNLASGLAMYLEESSVIDPENQKKVLDIIEYYIMTDNETIPEISSNMARAFAEFLARSPIVDPVKQRRIFDIIESKIIEDDKEDFMVFGIVLGALQSFLMNSPVAPKHLGDIHARVYDIYETIANEWRGLEDEGDTLGFVYLSAHSVVEQLNEVYGEDLKRHWKKLTEKQRYLVSMKRISDKAGYPVERYFYGETLFSVADILDFYPHSQARVVLNAIDAHIKNHPDIDDDFKALSGRIAEELSINLRFMADTGTPAVLNQSFADQIDANTHLQAFEENGIVLYGDQVLFGLTLQFEIDKPDSDGKNAVILDAIEAIARARAKQGRQLTQTEQNLIEAMLQLERPAVLGIDPLNARTRKRFDGHLNLIVASGSETSEKIAAFAEGLKSPDAVDRQEAIEIFLEFISHRYDESVEADVGDQKTVLAIVKNHLDESFEKSVDVRRLMLDVLEKFCDEVPIVDLENQKTALGIFADHLASGDLITRRSMALVFRRFLVEPPVAGSNFDAVLDIAEDSLKAENEEDTEVRLDVAFAFENFLENSAINDASVQKRIFDIAAHSLSAVNEENADIRYRVSTSLSTFVEKSSINDPERQKELLDIIGDSLNPAREEDSEIREDASGILYTFIERVPIDDLRDQGHIYAGLYRIFENAMKGGESIYEVLAYIYSSISTLAAILKSAAAIDEDMELTEEQIYIGAIDKMLNTLSDPPSKPYLYGETLLYVTGIMALHPERQIEEAEEAWENITGHIEDHSDADFDFADAHRAAEDLYIHLSFMRAVGDSVSLYQDYAEQIEASTYLQAVRDNGITLFNDRPLFGLTLQFEIDKPDDVGKNAVILDALQIIALTRKDQGRPLTQTEQNLIEAMLQLERPAALGIDPLNARTRKRFDGHLNLIVASGSETSEKIAAFADKLKSGDVNARREAAEELWNDPPVSADTATLKGYLDIFQHSLDTDEEEDHAVRSSVAWTLLDFGSNTDISDPVDQKTVLDIIHRSLVTKKDENSQVRVSVAQSLAGFLEKNPITDPENQKTALEIIEHVMNRDNEADDEVRSHVSDALQNLYNKSSITDFAYLERTFAISEHSLAVVDEPDSTVRSNALWILDYFFLHLPGDLTKPQKDAYYTRLYAVYAAEMKRGEDYDYALEYLYGALHDAALKLDGEEWENLTTEQKYISRILHVTDKIYTYVSKPYFHGDAILDIAAVMDIFPADPDPDPNIVPARAWENIVRYVENHTDIDEAFTTVPKITEELSLNLRFMHATDTAIDPDTDFADQIDNHDLLRRLRGEEIKLFDAPMFGLLGQIAADKPADDRKNKVLLEAIEILSNSPNYQPTREDIDVLEGRIAKVDVQKSNVGEAMRKLKVEANRRLTSGRREEKTVFEFAADRSLLDQIFVNDKGEVVADGSGTSIREIFAEDQLRAVQAEIKKYLNYVPLITLDDVSSETGHPVHLLDESQQIMDSFKAHGVIYMVMKEIERIIQNEPHLLKEGLKIVTQTTGNHGAAMIYAVFAAIDRFADEYPDLADDIRRIEPIVYTSTEVEAEKLKNMYQALKTYRVISENTQPDHYFIRQADTGGKAIADYDEAFGARIAYVSGTGEHARYMDHSGLDILIGHATAGLDIADKLSAAGVPDDEEVTLFVPIGAGGPLGVALGLLSVRPNARVVIVQTETYDAFIQTLNDGELVHENPAGSPTTVEFTLLDQVWRKIFEDGIAVNKMEGDLALQIARAIVDEGYRANAQAALDDIAPKVLRDIRTSGESSQSIVGGTTAISVQAALERTSGRAVILATEGRIPIEVHQYIDSKSNDVSSGEELSKDAFLGAEILTSDIYARERTSIKQLFDLAVAESTKTLLRHYPGLRRALLPSARTRNSLIQSAVALTRLIDQNQSRRSIWEIDHLDFLITQAAFMIDNGYDVRLKLSGAIPIVEGYRTESEDFADIERLFAGDFDRLTEKTAEPSSGDALSPAERAGQFVAGLFEEGEDLSETEDIFLILDTGIAAIADQAREFIPLLEKMLAQNGLDKNVHIIAAGEPALSANINVSLRQAQRKKRTIKKIISVTTPENEENIARTLRRWEADGQKSFLAVLDDRLLGAEKLKAFVPLLALFDVIFQMALNPAIIDISQIPGIEGDFLQIDPVSGRLYVLLSAESVPADRQREIREETHHVLIAA